MTVRDDVDAERSALADSLEAVGPQAATACGDWTAFDLAAHVVAAERAAGVLAFCVRTLAARGVQFSPRTEMAGWVIRRQRLVGYPALIARLREPSPRLLAPQLATFSLFKVLTHHDDLVTANGLTHAVPEHLAEGALGWCGINPTACLLPSSSRQIPCPPVGFMCGAGPLDSTSLVRT
ncbi:maleylpyruvate isomerase family mycothiol-dependent enzyme [Mycobacterium intracellulare]|uniref:maleylpyruvate isomerase family mycothiol-dependent enzyme n=1 Tax=Mycobacterium intracellulare TaxID=1767 RepID=UPI001EEE227D|nr:maleylpyruvate isomerase family mycothiol-dependent enzyme [Mycobacterium intracellulare]MEE3751893.1 maleylpyruvate isomerase family mycothiol-dependent enzyme [Mycobacterium intracellulare]